MPRLAFLRPWRIPSRRGPLGGMKQLHAGGPFTNGPYNRHRLLKQNAGANREFRAFDMVAFLASCSVHIAPVANFYDDNHKPIILDSVNHAVDADSDTVKILETTQFLHTWGAGIRGE